MDCIVDKVAKRLYTLRILKRAGLEPLDIVKVCISKVRSILEYAIQVWPDIPVYMSDGIESIQKRTLKIIYPDCSTYSQPFSQANLSSLAVRRDILCQRFISDMVNNHVNLI